MTLREENITNKDDMRYIAPATEVQPISEHGYKVPDQTYTLTSIGKPRYISAAAKFTPNKNTFHREEKSFSVKSSQAPLTNRSSVLG